MPVPVFTPFDGLMSVAKRLSGVLENRLGVSLWDGEDGLSGVTADILRNLGVPEKAISISPASIGITPRSVAESCGVVKRRRAKVRR